MFRGVYTATSGMMAHNRKQQMLTNNLANANTVGYKQDQAVLRAFPSQLLQAIQPSNEANHSAQQNRIGTLTTGVYVQEGIPSFVQGALKETGNRTDFSLLDTTLPINPDSQQQGTLVFAIQLENNETRYTRNGQFTVDQNGFLTTMEGHPVLNQDLQPIQVNTTEFSVLDNGEIRFADGTTNNDRLWLGYTEDPNQLVKEGHGMLRWDGPVAGLQHVEEVGFLSNGMPLVRQGFLEQSNVDITQTMTEMINTYRGFEANQKVIQAYDRSMEKTANEIGRV